MVWRDIQGKTGKLGYSRNLGFIYLDLIEDINKRMVDSVKIPLGDGIFEMYNINPEIVAVLEIKPTEEQLDNLYSSLPEDLADLNGGYNTANLYLGEKNRMAVTPKFPEDRHETEEYEIKGILDDSQETVNEEELIGRLKHSPSLNLVATKFESTSKYYGEIEQSLFFEITPDSVRIHLSADPASKGIDLIGLGAWGDLLMIWTYMWIRKL
ncbi:MAG: hypothetical protein DRP06_00930 [Candidatus Aenigmatarchaeota archaeon]|nr:MAG: hypothetical protein DRP06_00930 [Candidatus Aenigmarchaeota archaeon]